MDGLDATLFACLADLRAGLPEMNALYLGAGYCPSSGLPTFVADRR
jgi:hypothetical protein